MANSSSSSLSSSKASISPHRLYHFTPIAEGNEEDELKQGRCSFRATPASEYVDRRDSDCHQHQHQHQHQHHHPTPLHHSEKQRNRGSSRKPPENDEQTGVLCNKCRPSNREKISVVHFDSNGAHRLSMASPNGLFKSIIASLAMKKSPKSSDGSSVVSRDDHWKIVVGELSTKLVQATRKRDEANLEASKLKYSMSELEKKLYKLEIYCHSLKSELEVCNSGTNNQYQKQEQHKSPSRVNYNCIKVGDQQKVIQPLLVLVSETRSSVRVLSRALALQLRQIGGRVYDRISQILKPYDIKFSFSKNPRGSLFYLEALLNRAFYEDFESIGFQKSSTNPVLNPIDHCESNFAMFSRLHEVTWEEVLNKGTRHFSEEFSRFCDRKMNEIVAMLGWNRAWPEPLLQAFFGASKAVWLVHLLSHSVHPALPIFRVDKGAGFDPVYMEDMAGGQAKKLVPAMVRIMVTPGFYVYDSVVKCKVLCRYYNNNVSNAGEVFDQRFSPSPS